MIRKLRSSACEKEIMEITPFSIAIDNIKYLGVSLIKPGKHVYVKNVKSLRNQTEEDIRR